MTRALPLLLVAALVASCAETTDPLCEDRFSVWIYDAEGMTGDKTLTAGDSILLIGVVLSGEPFSSGRGCGEYLYSSSTRPQEFAWSSTDTTIVQIPVTGRANAVSPGIARVRVWHGEQFDEISVTVRPRASPGS